MRLNHSKFQKTSCKINELKTKVRDELLQLSRANMKIENIKNELQAAG